MQRSSFVGRYGERQTRCVDESGRFAPCDGRGLGFIDAPRRMGFLEAPRYGRMGFNVPVVGSVTWPRSISFDTVPGLIGIGLGKLGPGLLSGILGRIVAGGESWTKWIVGGVSGLALLSERFRRNSYLTGFALAALPDMVEPMLQGVLDAFMPAATAATGMRRMGALNRAEAEALRRAHARLLSSADGGGFVGRNIPLPSDIMATTRRVPLSGAGLNDNGLRNLA